MSQKQSYAEKPGLGAAVLRGQEGLLSTWDLRPVGQGRGDIDKDTAALRVERETVTGLESADHYKVELTPRVGPTSSKRACRQHLVNQANNQDAENRTTRNELVRNGNKP